MRFVVVFQGHSVGNVWEFYVSRAPPFKWFIMVRYLVICHGMFFKREPQLAMRSQEPLEVRISSQTAVFMNTTYWGKEEPKNPKNKGAWEADVSQWRLSAVSQFYMDESLELSIWRSPHLPSTDPWSEDPRSHPHHTYLAKLRRDVTDDFCSLSRYPLGIALDPPAPLDCSSWVLCYPSFLEFNCIELQFLGSNGY